MSGVEKSTGGNGKAAIQKALAASFEFCESAWASLDATKSAEIVKTFLGVQPRFSVLTFNTSHVWEHYGNLVTYMRSQGHRPALQRTREVTEHSKIDELGWGGLRPTRLPRSGHFTGDELK